VTTVPRPVARHEAIARSFVGVATAFYLLVLAWGIYGRFGAGHEGVAASRGIAADNMVAWHILSPVREYLQSPPTPSSLYVNHPFGMFWLVGLLAKIFGRHVWVARLPAVVLSAAIPPMLYGIGRRMWGPIPGTLAALAYVVLPITLTFGNVPGFEEPLCFGVVLTTWGYVAFAERWQRRWMIVSLAGVLFSANIDWIAGVFHGAVLGGLLVAHLTLPPRWFGRIRTRRFAHWWAWAAAFAALVPAAYWLYFAHIDVIAGILGQEAKRVKGHDTPLAEVLAARSTWIDAMFTPAAILLGKIAAPVFVVRLVFLRRIHDLFPLSMLAMAVVHYVWFKEAADLHIYWPLLFAPYFALSVAVLMATASALATRVLALRVRRERLTFAVPLVVAGLFAGLLLEVLPDGLRQMVYGRRTGLRFNDSGHLNFHETDKAQALEWMGRRMDKNGVVGLHGGMHPTWSQAWALYRTTINYNRVPDAGSASPRYFAADLAFLGADDQLLLAERFHVTVVGQYAYVDCLEDASPGEAFVFDEREPGFIQWYFYSGVDPVRTIRRDAWRTWELRDAWGQTPNPPPESDPVTPDELRIAHNVAVASGRSATAVDLSKRLEGSLDESIAADLAGGARLLGRRMVKGVAPVLELYFVAGSSSADDAQVKITSETQPSPSFSLVPRDDKTKEVGMPFVIPPKLWRPGYVYVDRTEVAPRPGKELWTMSFAGASVAVLTLPTP
jgi:hypothetical protein